MTSPGNAILRALTDEAYAKTDQKRRASRTHRHLTPTEEVTILASYRRGYTQKELATIYDVAQATISRTITRQLARRNP